MSAAGRPMIADYRIIRKFGGSRNLRDDGLKAAVMAALTRLGNDALFSSIEKEVELPKSRFGVTTIYPMYRKRERLRGILLKLRDDQMIELYPLKDRKRRIGNHSTKERNETICKQFAVGISVSTIADEQRVTGERIRQILRRAGFRSTKKRASS